jgi:riboflavin kinase
VPDKQSLTGEAVATRILDINMKVLSGRVVSGVRSFSYWMKKLEAHYTRKTGMKLFPGTLNTELNEIYTLPERRIRLEKEEYAGSVSMNIVPCKIFGRDAFVLRTDKAESEQGLHPKSILEIACEVKLRDLYNLKDGDRVEVPE